MSILEKLELELYKKRIPMTVTVELTKRCNLDCRHCYVDHNDLDNELSIDDFKDVIDQLEDMGVMIIALSGGEVFYKKDSFKLIEYIRSKNMGVKLITTATLLNKKDANYLKELGVLEVGLSLYSDKENVHNYITKKESFKKTLEMAIYLKKIGVNVLVKTLIMNLNYKDIKGLHSLLSSYDIPCQFDLGVTDSQNNVREVKKFSLSDEQLLEMYLDEEIRNILYNVKSFEETYCEKGRLENYNDEDAVCSIARTSMWINSKGEVFPCIHFPYPIGDLKKRPLKEIWYNNKMIDRILERSKYKYYKKCHSCSASKYCSPCLALNYMENKEHCNSNNKRDAFSVKKVVNLIYK